MTNVMAILQDVDKCMRCNGCVISCKRTWKMKALNLRGVHKTAPDQRVIIKSQKRVDMGPFMRYSCWHCANPPCAASAARSRPSQRGRTVLSQSITRCATPAASTPLA